MSQTEEQLSEKQSLDLITQMINKAKNSYHDTGVDSMMWGAVIAFCSLEKFCEIYFGYELPFDIYLLTIVAVIPQIFIIIKQKKERRVKSYDDIYMKYIWIAFGISIFLLILIINNIYGSLTPFVDKYQQLSGSRIDWTHFGISEYVSSLFLLLYGIPTFITGAACKFTPMLLGGLLCWACCIAALYTSLEMDLLLTAFSAVFAWLIPGILMELDYRQAKKELAKQHV